MRADSCSRPPGRRPTWQNIFSTAIEPPAAGSGSGGGGSRLGKRNGCWNEPSGCVPGHSVECRSRPRPTRCSSGPMTRSRLLPPTDYRPESAEVCGARGGGEDGGAGCDRPQSTAGGSTGWWLWMWLLHHGKVRLRCSCSMRNWRCDCPCSPPLPPLVNTLKSSCLSLFTQPHHTHTRLRCSLCIGHPSGHACLTAATAQSSNHARCQYPRSRAVLMYAQCCSRLCVARAAHCCESSPLSSSSSSHTHTTRHTTHAAQHTQHSKHNTSTHTTHSMHSTSTHTHIHSTHT